MRTRLNNNRKKCKPWWLTKGKKIIVVGSSSNVRRLFYATRRRATKTYCLMHGGPAILRVSHFRYRRAWFYVVIVEFISVAV